MRLKEYKDRTANAPALTSPEVSYKQREMQKKLDAMELQLQVSNEAVKNQVRKIICPRGLQETQRSADDFKQKYVETKSKMKVLEELNKTAKHDAQHAQEIREVTMIPDSHLLISSA